MRPNKLRELLRAGKPTLGTRVMSPWPTVIEVLGQARQYDYVEFLAEYSPPTSTIWTICAGRPSWPT